MFILLADWHMAYVLLYGPRILEIDPEEIKRLEEAAAKEESTKGAENGAEKRMDTA